MTDRRQTILHSALALLGEQGYAGLTQRRVAGRAGIRPGHLTYYFPTRLDLLLAVARVALVRQLAAIDLLPGEGSPKRTAVALADVLMRRENTRSLMALTQAAGKQTAIRGLLRELVTGTAERSDRLFSSLMIPSTERSRHLLHALSVGLAVVELATARQDGQRRTVDTLATTFDLLKRI